ncbi:MAG: hypothetical protein CVT94_14120 [Bacteroidetes bacterium HGW-Bacteroidetes-11]|jgi:hypothetical protein|nr:MAG: hypothetical protein CVT94_14120 [Bacteroidetes bacterium HGW-Bacteroidetes-11]
MRRTNISWSIASIVVIIILILFRNVQLSVNHPQRSVIEADVLHYYAYLPALLVYNDLNLDFVAKAPGKFSDRFWPVTAPNGKYVIMTTMGMSIMYSPFVVPTHYFLKFTGNKAEGYSLPYIWALIFSSVFYILISLILLRRMLKPLYSEKTIAATLLIVILGTNIIHYITREAAFSHAYSFFLIVWLIYIVDKYYKKPSAGNALLVGFISGLITLVRPTNAVALILIPLWSIGSLSDLRERLMLIFKNWHHLILLMFTLILTWVPQIIYWKMTSGQYFFNGYGDGGRFFFGNPQIINILFSYRKGWLLYTPSMILAIAGFVWLYKSNKPYFYPILIFFVINTWVLASWWLWWFGGSYGNRAFIDMYGLLAFPLAAFIQRITTHVHWSLKSLSWALFLLFIVHNLFQLQQYHNGAIHYASMTKEAYWDSFGNLKPSPDFYKLVSFPDYEAAKKGIYPKPVIKVPEKTEKTIEFYEKQLRSNPKMIKILEEKAILENITLDSMIKRDAIWLYNNKK